MKKLTILFISTLILSSCFHQWEEGKIQSDEVKENIEIADVNNVVEISEDKNTEDLYVETDNNTQIRKWDEPLSAPKSKTSYIRKIEEIMTGSSTVSSGEEIQKNAFELDKYEDYHNGKLYDTFPKPQSIEISYINETSLMPRERNNSKIYFDFGWNSWKFSLGKDTYKLVWGIINDVEKVEVIWDWDMDPYFLKSFTPGEREFTYNISEKFSNLNTWKNVYLIRGYAKWKVYERMFVVNYYNENARFIMEKTDEKIWWYWDDWENCYYWKYRITEWEEFNTVELWFDASNLSKQVIQLDSEVEVILKYGKKRTSEFSISYLEDSIKKVVMYDGEVYLLTCDQFSHPKIHLYPNGDMLILRWTWHEWSQTYMLFHSQTRRIYDMGKLLWEKAWREKNYFPIFEVSIEEDFIIFRQWSIPSGYDVEQSIKDIKWPNWELKLDRTTLDLVIE